jgi:hypothetical protein
MRTACRIPILFLGMALFSVSAQGKPHTPKPGSPERKAICDAMRLYVVKDVSRPLPKPILFKIEFLRVDGDYAGFEGFPVFEDGSEVVGKLLPDIVSTTILKRNGAGWRIIVDLSRSDVPSAEELVGIRKSIPSEVPASVLPGWWRQMLHR